MSGLAVVPHSERAPTVTRARLEARRDAYALQRAEWQDRATQAQRQMDALDGALQACEDLLALVSQEDPSP